MPPAGVSGSCDRFWRHEDFHAELKRLTAEPGVASRHIPKASARRARSGRSPRRRAEPCRAISSTNGIDLVGVRSASEIAASLLGRVADASSDPLSPATGKAHRELCRHRRARREAATRVREIVRDTPIDIRDALDSLERRFDLLAEAGIDLERAEFSAEFGRALEYYTGFVFEVVSPKPRRA